MNARQLLLLDDISSEARCLQQILGGTVSISFDKDELGLSLSVPMTSAAVENLYHALIAARRALT